MTFSVKEGDAGRRLDIFVSEYGEISRSASARLIEEGAVTVNGAKSEKKYSLRLNDEVEITLPVARPLDVVAENIPLDIVHEDDDIIVINKPSGMVVHPAPGNENGTLVNALLYHCRTSLSGIGGVMRPGIVHRIDKDTSGLLVVAKNDEAHIKLSRELEEHKIIREYHALARGGFRSLSGTVDAPIGRHPTDRKRMAVVKCGGKSAVTHYYVNKSYGDITYLKLILETGRTHQIRVHMSYIGHALLGDEVYAPGKIRFEKLHAPLLDGQALHAKALTLTHPVSGERMRFETELPSNFSKMLDILDASIEE